MKVVDLPHDPVFVSQLFEKVELEIGEQHHVNTTALRRMVPPMRQGGLFVLLARRVSSAVRLYSSLPLYWVVLRWPWLGWCFCQASLWAICSSRISRTVNGTITRPLLRKNAPISVIASLE